MGNVLGVCGVCRLSREVGYIAVFKTSDESSVMTKPRIDYGGLRVKEDANLISCIHCCDCCFRPVLYGVTPVDIDVCRGYVADKVVVLGMA